jgi:hypothetical protein
VWLTDPGAVRRAGVEQLTAWLHERGVRKAPVLARTALAAADQQSVRMPAEDLTARIVGELARQVLELDRRIDDLDEVLTTGLRRHPQAKILTSLPGMGCCWRPSSWWPSGDLASFASVNHLAALRRVGAGPLGFGPPQRRPAPTPSATTGFCCGSSTSRR